MHYNAVNTLRLFSLFSVLHSLFLIPFIVRNPLLRSNDFHASYLFRGSIFPSPERKPGEKTGGVTSSLSRLLSSCSSSSSSPCATAFSCMLSEPWNRLRPGPASMPRTKLALARGPSSRRTAVRSAYGRVYYAQHIFVYNTIT